MCVFFVVKLPKEISSEEEEGENQCGNGEARLRDTVGCLLWALPNWDASLTVEEMWILVMQTCRLEAYTDGDGLCVCVF